MSRVRFPWLLLALVILLAAWILQGVAPSPDSKNPGSGVEGSSRAGAARGEEAEPLPSKPRRTVTGTPVPDRGRDLEVAVLDARGRPAPRLPLALTTLSGHGPFATPSPILVRHTDPGGRVFLDGLERIFREHDGKQLQIRPLILLHDPPVLPLTAEDLPSEPLVLRLPPTASVRVEVLDPTGRPAPDGTSVFLVRLLESNPEPVPVPWPGGREERDLRNGAAIFPRVGLGIRLRAVARIPGWNEPLQMDLDGPVLAGEEVLVRLQPRPTDVIVTGRLLDPAGQPMSNRSLRARLLNRYGSGRTFSTACRLSTDDGGRFFWILETAEAVADLQRLLQFEDDRTGSRLDLRIPSDLPPGVTDLGDLRLRTPVLLVSGRVVDMQGRPVTDAGVRMTATPESLAGRRILDPPTGRTGSDGTFAFRGLPDAFLGLELVLEVDHRDFLGRKQPVHLGDQGLVLRLEQGASLRGSVLVDEGLDPSALEVLFLDPEGGSSSAYWRDREFFWTALDADRGSIQIRDGIQQLLASVDDLALVRGRENRDPRIQEIDLRGRLRSIRLRVTNEEGEPVAHVRLQPAGLEDPYFTWSDGTAEFLVESGIPTLLVEAEGYLPRHLPNVTGDTEIVLRRRPE